MKVLLTGATGFVGASVLRQLVATPGVQVAALVRNPETAWRIRDELGQTRVLPLSLQDTPRLRGELGEFRPSHVAHLAWSGVLGKHRNDTAQHQNTADSLQLLELAIESGARHFIGLGSQAEYGPCQARIDESTPTAPTTAYGEAKLATGTKAAARCERADVRFAWLRLFSSYGPRDNPEWLIPYLTLKLLRRERPEVTAAEQRWDYIYVEDAAAAVVATLKADGARGVFNLGSGTAPRLRDIIEAVRNEIDPALPVGFGEVPYRPDQVMHLEADIRKLAGATGWKPATNLEEGIRKTVDWFRTHDARP